MNSLKYLARLKRNGGTTTVSENLVTLQLSDFMMRKLQYSRISRYYNRIFIIGIFVTRIERKYKYYIIGYPRCSTIVNPA